VIGALNQLLEYISCSDRAAVEQHLEDVELPRRFRLAHPRRHIDHVYFIDEGLASIVVAGRSGEQTEVAVIGREGASGCPIFLEADRSFQDIYMQVEGKGRRIEAHEVARLLNERHSLRRVFLRYAHTVSVQQDETALAAARGTTRQRLARWLLMAQDRLGDDLDLTQDVLSLMLGVRRPGVTIALQEFAAARLKGNGRGKIHVRDREGLKSVAGSFYGAPRAEYDRLFSAGKVARRRL
jgi:CRP-like cAMP-binding protein